MHDIVTGFWQPNSADLAAGLSTGFGATINVMNGGIECGRKTDQAANRVSYYQSFMSYLGVSTSGETLGCDKQ